MLITYELSEPEFVSVYFINKLDEEIRIFPLGQEFIRDDDFNSIGGMAYFHFDNEFYSDVDLDEFYLVVERTIPVETMETDLSITVGTPEQDSQANFA
jgi:hypothetical protein